ncbi:hypothetical protein CcCBS67573_g04816 [Chytriomyces confervae]|uniref:3'-5' exonuclease domain-containing protein n=1 Tax=Chytriomyces confervae TaxID=246404 RepID=A0A507FEB1_9FUNG|nr:hypothetical protein CcCBS67573_g04816 [Chytriomyces confervae]
MSAASTGTGSVARANRNLKRSASTLSTASSTAATPSPAAVSAKPTPSIANTKERHPQNLNQQKTHSKNQSKNQKSMSGSSWNAHRGPPHVPATTPITNARGGARSSPSSNASYPSSSTSVSMPVREKRHRSWQDGNKDKSSASKTNYDKQEKRLFCVTYDALVTTLESASKESVESIGTAPIVALFEDKSKFAKLKIDFDMPLSEANKHLFLPPMSEKGLLVKTLQQRMTGNMPKGLKAFWSSRHHSGGFASFLAFFPSTFTFVRGGGLIQNPLRNSMNLGIHSEIADADRIRFSSDPIVKLDPRPIFDAYEASGFDPPLCIASDLPYPLVACKLPTDFQLVYGTTDEICNQFVRERLVARVDESGLWIPHANITLGFDSETTVKYFSTHDKTATSCLLQISTNTSCLLVHQSAIASKRLPQSIVWLLNHPDIKKVCASAVSEVNELKKFQGVSPMNFDDISRVAQNQVVLHAGNQVSAASAVAASPVVPASPNNSTTDNATTTTSSNTTFQQPLQKQIGLSTLAAIHLGLKLAKPRVLQVGDWKKPLNAAQKAYAATDAWMSLVVYQVLNVAPGLRVAGDGCSSSSSSSAMMDVENVCWWADEGVPVRRVALVGADAVAKWEKTLVGEYGMGVVHCGDGGVHVYAERPGKPIDASFLREFYGIYE